MANKQKRAIKLKVKGWDETPKRVRITYTPELTARIKLQAEPLKGRLSNRRIAKVLGVGRMFINRIFKAQ